MTFIKLKYKLLEVPSSERDSSTMSGLSDPPLWPCPTHPHCSFCSCLAQSQFSSLHLLPSAHKFAQVSSQGALQGLVSDGLVQDHWPVWRHCWSVHPIQDQRSANHILYTMDDETKKFAFTVEDYDMFEVCLERKGPGQIADQHVFLDMKHGDE